MNIAGQPMESGAMTEITAATFTDWSEKIWGDPDLGQYAAIALRHTTGLAGLGAEAEVVDDEAGCRYLNAPSLGYNGRGHPESLIDGPHGSDFQIRSRAHDMLNQPPLPYVLRMGGPEEARKIKVGPMHKASLARWILSRNLTNHNFYEDVGRALDLMTVVAGLSDPEKLPSREWPGPFIDASELLDAAERAGQRGDASRLDFDIQRYAIWQAVTGEPVPSGEIIVRGAKLRSCDQIALASLKSIAQITASPAMKSFLKFFFLRKQGQLDSWPA